MHLEPWEIETAKPLPTIVDAVFPEQGAHDVPINAPLILSLNVPIAVNDYTSNVELHREDGTLVESVHLARRNVVDAETVIVEFALQLEANTSYYVVILRKAVALQGAPYGYIGDYGDPPGDQTDPQMWRFTTGTEVDPALDGLIPEAPLPTIVDSVLPADDEVNVATNTPLMMNLNARVGVDAYTSHIAIHLAATGEEVERVRLEPIDMLDNQTMGVILSQELEPFTDYYVTIDRKALRVDDAPYGIIGNYAASFDGNSLEPDMWNFTTGEGRDPALDSPFGEADLPQVVEAVEPMDNAIDVQLDAVLFLHMNVGVIVNEYTTGISLHRLEDGALIEQFTFGPADQLDATTIMVTPSALLDPDTEYYVTIDRKATLINEAPYGYIGDYTSYVDGNSIHPTMWNFRTTSGL